LGKEFRNFMCKYIMDTNIDKKVPKSSEQFYCKKCEYSTSRKSQWDRHISTAKHLMMTKVDDLVQKNAHICNCGKQFGYRQSLYVHKKKCKNDKKIDNEENITEKITSEMVLKLITQNTDLQKMMHEQNTKMCELMEKASVTKSKNVTNIVTQNNFNLNVYLNEECKDALNLVEFVEGLKVSLSDLEETAKIGYTEGVSRIFINGLNELEVNKRPIHCSDGKREVLYIKESDEWSKEDEKKSHLTKAIKKVSNKNIKQIYEWKKKYPNYKDPESKESDRYMEMIYNTMSGSTTEEQESNMNKIIKNITKKTIIDKSMI